MSVLTLLRADGQARLAFLETGHGRVETPVFMPVGTQGAVKAILNRDLKEMGAQMILGNAYHLYLRPGDELVRDMGGIQRFAGWDGAVLTDSGGYQVFSLGVLRKIQEEGVTFQSHLDGSKHFLTPERIVEVQENLGADVCMCLDECVAILRPTNTRAPRSALRRVGPSVAGLRRRHRPCSSASSRAGCTRT